MFAAPRSDFAPIAQSGTQFSRMMGVRDRMFSPPENITASVFTRLPEHLHIKDRRTAWTDARQHGVPHSFLEGPSFDRKGRFYCTDIPYGRIFRISPQGEWEVFAEYDGEPNGLKIHKDGRIFICDRRKGIVALDPETGRFSAHLERAYSEAFRGVNDLVFASNGDLYFTDQGQSGLHDPTGRVYRLRANGDLTCLLNNVPSPNGIALNPAEDILYVAVTRGNAVWRVPLLPSGEVTKVGVFLHLSGGLGGPDGLAVDVEGNLAVAIAGLGTVWVFSRLGEPLYRIRSEVGLRTNNIAYGGEDGRTLFITESTSGSVLKAPLPVPGLPLFSHQDAKANP